MHIINCKRVISLMMIVIMAFVLCTFSTSCLKYFDYCTHVNGESEDNSFAGSAFPRAYFLPDGRNSLHNQNDFFDSKYFFVLSMSIFILFVKMHFECFFTDKQQRKIFKLRI